MKNRITLKKLFISCVMACLCFLFLFLLCQWKEYQTYTRNYNQTLYVLMQTITTHDSSIREADLLEILNHPEIAENPTQQQSFMAQYGIDLQHDSLILANQHDFIASLICNAFLVLGFFVVLMILFFIYHQKQEHNLRQIMYYLEEINRRNYKLDIDSNSEDELSILKNELYKTTVMLKETAEHSVQAKNTLKDALSDISHQLKTPLTSILIMLDDLIDQPDMDSQTQQKFIRKIKREIQSIHFLVQALLKLSRLEANAVTFSNEKVDICKIILTAIENVDTLCDLKNIQIKLLGSSDQILADAHWQTEAITNILKNSVEHAPESSTILIHMHTNPVYVSITIQNYGPEIEKEEQKHIFERFYKGKHASPDSIGIGLSLAKAIIEANHGQISVASDETLTTFTIKYYKFCGD